MKDIEVKEKYEKIVTHTLSKNLKAAFDLLNELLAEVHKADWLDKKNELEQNYQYLLQYVINGVKDPEQEKIYNKIRLSLLGLADQVYNAFMTSYSNAYPYIQKRNISKVAIPSNIEIDNILSDSDLNSIDDLLKDINIETKATQKEVADDEKDNVIDIVFMRLWLKASYSDRETALVESIIYNDFISEQYKSIAISALMLGLLLQFDEKKFHLLLSILDVASGNIQIRAMIAFILCCNAHSQRIVLYPELLDKISSLAKKNWFATKFTTCILLYINGLETEKISAEVKDKIIPDIMKSSAAMSKKIDLGKLDNLENIFEENPEWKSTTNNDITEKIERFTELQRNGADVFLSTFSSLKKHAFFGHICNWFRPYDTKNSWVKREFKGKDYKLFDLISINPTICDSDRYSMLFSLSSVPENYLSQLENSIKSQEEQIKYLQKDNILNEGRDNGQLGIQLYWQDLYRFFKLFPFKSDFPDPYTEGIDINKFTFKDLLDNSTLKNIADAYFKKNFYSKAIKVYELIKGKETDINILQKIGYSYQKKCFYDEALSYYEKAELMESSIWVSKMKAACLMKLMRYNEALTEYQIVQRQDENNLSVTLNMAQCHIEMSEYKEALPLLYKLEYLSPSNKVYRIIAWCAFLCENIEQTEKYFSKIPEEERIYSDWMRMGHVSLCKNEKMQAVECYAKAKNLMEDKTNFENLFFDDIPLLEKNGLNKDEIPFLLDKIRYTAC